MGHKLAKLEVQLDYFIDCIEKRVKDNLSSFSEAFKTDKIMQQIITDAMDQHRGN